MQFTFSAFSIILVVDCISRADLKHSDMEEIEKTNSIPEIERFILQILLNIRLIYIDLIQSMRHAKYDSEAVR